MNGLESGTEEGIRERKYMEGWGRRDDVKGEGKEWAGERRREVMGREGRRERKRQSGERGEQGEGEKVGE